MAWFCNYYECERCGHFWRGKWSYMCDDDCPSCGARHMSPLDSDDLTQIIKEDQDEYVVLWSPETAEHKPDYQELGRFATRELAERFLTSDERCRA